MATKNKSGNKMTTTIAKIRDDERKMSEKFANHMRKKFYNANVQKFLKKHNISLFNVFHNESICR